MPSNMDVYVAAYGGNLPADRFRWVKPTDESIPRPTTEVLTTVTLSGAGVTNPYLEVVETGCEGIYED